MASPMQTMALGSVLLVFAACAGPSATDGAVADGEKVRCETITPVGSRLGKRVCMTEAEWDVWSREQQERGDQLRRPGQTPERRSTAGGG